jgi:RNase H-fold protein (predicted Holliday junction resolvase)
MQSLPPQSLKETILSMKEKEPVAGIVFGLSVATNGIVNEISDTVRSVADSYTSIAPVYFEQEMFSSVEAHRFQTDAGDRDDSAAAIILQRFLDKNKK